MIFGSLIQVATEYLGQLMLDITDSLHEQMLWWVTRLSGKNMEKHF
jgi:hypothetical protein